MPLRTGTRIGPYEITAPLGAGGMGDVYLSRDTKLKRNVAVKVLSEEFSRDPDRTRRFRREAEVLATLNHPHIAQIYGLEESGDTLCLVLELVDGETLAERIRRGPIPMEEALLMASQISQALEAAHERDIVHRDLKPANIKITPEGTVKVLDFGLAKTMERETADSNASQSPTMISGTMQGVILGTAAYMSPEQSKGRPADARSDNWAFGCVLYEMLTAKPAFSGDDVSEILAGILKSDPDWTALPSATPSMIHSLLRRCLQKDRMRRLRAIADARFQIEEALSNSTDIPMTASPRRSIERLGWLTAMAVLIIGFAALVSYFRAGEVNRSRETYAVSILLPENMKGWSFKISPDGRHVAFSTAQGLWVRPLDSPEAKRLNTENAATVVCWSPDVRWIAYLGDGKLKKIDSTGGSSQVLADWSGLFGDTCSQDVILLSNGFSLFRVSSDGGQPLKLSQFDALVPEWPHFLPDGNHFVFTSWSPKLEERGIYVGALDSEKTQRLLPAVSRAVYAAPGFLLFVQQGRLMAARFDAQTLSLTGEPFKIADGVTYRPGCSCADFSASGNGVIAYRAGTNEELVQMTWFDRTGKRIGPIGKLDTVLGARFSPDGRRLALNRVDPVSGVAQIWLMDDLEKGVASPLTFEGENNSPVWSPDAKTIAFAAWRNGVRRLYTREAAGGAEKPFKLDVEYVADWSKDGRFIVGSGPNAGTGYDLLLIPTIGDGEAKWLKSPRDQGHPRISPDGKWLAYTSDESGQMEVYVQRFPQLDGRPEQVSEGTGSLPRWRGDGKELFYLRSDRTIMSVSIELGDSVRAGPPKPLFQAPPLNGSWAFGGLEPFEVTPDGQRLLVIPSTPGSESSSSISLIINWQAGQQL